MKVSGARTWSVRIAAGMPAIGGPACFFTIADISTVINREIRKVLLECKVIGCPNLVLNIRKFDRRRIR